MIDPIERAYKTIESCETFGQVMIAGKYMRLAIARGPGGLYSSQDIRIRYREKINSIVVENRRNEIRQEICDKYPDTGWRVV